MAHDPPVTYITGSAEPCAARPGHQLRRLSCRRPVPQLRSRGLRSSTSSAPTALCALWGAYGPPHCQAASTGTLLSCRTRTYSTIRLAPVLLPVVNRYATYHFLS